MSSLDAGSVKATKKSAFSCDQCRKRKVKCGGEQPVCRRCTARDEQCRYMLNPTLSYTQTLENKVKELRDEVQTLQINQASMSDSQPRSRVPARTSPPSLGTELSCTFDGLKFDDKGGITYHGATSFFQLPTSASPNGSSDAIQPQATGQVEGGDRKERLVNNAWQQRALETLSETPEPFHFLLEVHWCWIQPLFNFVYRPAFTRDMELLGPYYSHTLLNAMISHSVRWCRNDANISALLEPYENGRLFSRQARTLLFEEVRDGRSTIPTVQTLLLLSAQECSAGNRTQAWLYSGMAFRLIEDMGISIDGQKYAGTVQLSDEDVEIRHRLFWSCYFWDKMISLYLGRSPTLQHSTVSPPQIMLDDSAETEIWKPHGVKYASGVHYPPTPAHSISCFMKMCQLAEIFNQILIHIYHPLNHNTEAEIQACLSTEGEALRQWWEYLPSYLLIDVRDLPPFCPPSHIVTLNCLYHTFKILLYRPMLFSRHTVSPDAQKPNAHHLIECISSATSIICIFDLFCRTFGDDYCILSLSYSVYTAASMFLLQVQATSARDEQTLRRLDFCIKALERVKKINPVIGSSLNLITQALSKLNIHLPSSSLSDEPASYKITAPLAAPSFLPLTGEAYPATSQIGVPIDATDASLMPPIKDFNMQELDISPEMLDAFSYLEPVDPTVGALYDPR